MAEMNLLFRNGLLSALAILFGGAMILAHADQESISIKARFGGMHRGFVPNEVRHPNLGDIRTVVIHTEEEFQQFKQGIPMKAVGMYPEEMRPVNHDPLREQKINFNDSTLVVALRDMAYCNAVSIDSAYREGKTLGINLKVPVIANNGECQSDGSDMYTAAVIEVVGDNVEFTKK